MLLLLLSHFSSVRLCATPYGSPPGSPCPWNSPDKNTGVGCHFLLQCMKVKSESEVTQSCPTLCDPMDCSLPGSSIHGIFQARVLEWGAIAFSLLYSSLHYLTTVTTKKNSWDRQDYLFCGVFNQGPQFSSVAQSCLTLSNPMDCSLPGSSVHGIFQARVLEWVSIAFFII